VGLLVEIERTLENVETGLVNVALATGALRRSVHAMWKRRHPNGHGGSEFFTQRMVVENYRDRLPLLRELCAGKDVLHVGCADWPIFDPQNNLHLQLAPIARSIAGLDTDTEGLERLRAFHDGRYYTRVAEVDRPFDVLLVPEVIEHVPNAGEFLTELDRIDFHLALVTGPNALIRPPNPLWHETYRASGNTLVEFVHPDHKCYYSPYTLRNTIESLTPWSVTRIGTTTNETAVFVQATKRA
jgi:hypothetical protein